MYKYRGSGYAAMSCTLSDRASATAVGRARTARATGRENISRRVESGNSRRRIQSDASSEPCVRCRSGARARSSRGRRSRAAGHTMPVEEGRSVWRDVSPASPGAGSDRRIALRVSRSSPRSPAAWRFASARRPRRRRRRAGPAGDARIHGRRTSPASKRRPLTRWLPVSGTLQPVNQTRSRPRSPAKSARCWCARAKRSRPARCSPASTPPTSTPSSTDRIGALEASRAQLALAEKTRHAEPHAAQAELHLAERLRQRREQPVGEPGHAQVLRGAGAAREERAARRGRDRAAVGHGRQAPRAAGREGQFRLAAVHRRRPRPDGAAGDGAGQRHSRDRRRHAGRAVDRRLWRARASRARSSASIR